MMKLKELLGVTTLAFIVLSHFGCVVSDQKLFANVEPAGDASYGYTAENPITIRNSDLSSSINSSYYFLSRLRSGKGNRLEIIRRYSVENPNYGEPTIQLQNRFTGEPINNGNGPLLDFYLLKPENESDTISLYINPYLKGEIKVPVGLRIAAE